MSLECPVARLARETPNGTAIVFNGAAWTWSQLARHVAACERTLASHPPGSRVGLLHGNHPDMVAFLVASARLGLCTVLLNTRLTSTELGTLASLARLEHVYSDAALAASWPNARLLAPEEHANDTLPNATLAGTFVLFTSGTTGVPKGACLTTENLHASSVASGTNLGHGTNQVWLGTLPLFHVGGLAMVWRCLFYGATLSLHARFDAADTVRTLGAQHITHASLVPTTLKRLVEAGSLPSLPHLKAILVGGGPCSLDLMARARTLGLPVVATYGLTEATSQVATQSLSEPPMLCAPPLKGVSVRVVDAHREDVRLGVEGEIEVRGPTVMAGYLDNPLATSAALGADGWLRTRDVGRLDAQGRLTVVARRTDLIIRGGENIYPAEVEATLQGHPLVEDAAICGRADAEWGQVPVAFVVLRGTVSDGELHAFCRQTLAAYKVPAAFLAVPVLPRNAMGKVDRAALLRLA